MLEIWESYVSSDIDTIKWETHFHFALFHFLIPLLYVGLCKVSLVKNLHKMHNLIICLLTKLSKKHIFLIHTRSSNYFKIYEY
jgi:hypothetical protein